MADEPSVRDRLVMLGQGCRLWHDPRHTAYATITVGDHVENRPILGRHFRAWLLRRFMKEVGGTPGKNAMEEALFALCSMAIADGEEHETYVRIAPYGDEILIDTGNARWESIGVTPDGWDIGLNSPVRFIRSYTLKPLPTPEPGGSLDDLRIYFNVQTESDMKLVLGWLISSMRPRGPYQILSLNGEQGTGKSMSARKLRRLIDPNTAELRSPPREERDLVIAAVNGLVVAFDNLSQVRPWLSDALCRISTGGGLSTRRLYTDAEEFVHEACRPVLLTGIPPLAERGDLADRTVAIQLPTLEDRRTEAQIWAEFDGASPKLFGALLDTLAAALENLPKIRLLAARESWILPRMADAALFVEAAADHLGWHQGEYVEIVAANQQSQSRIVVESNVVSIAMVRFLNEVSDWEGTATELEQRLTEYSREEERHSRDWPKNARVLSTRLTTLAPDLRRLGYRIDSRLLHGITRWTFGRGGLGTEAFPPSQPCPPQAQDGGGLGAQGGQLPLPKGYDGQDEDLDEREAIQAGPDPEDPDDTASTHLPWK